jgi:hypothetical protein
MLSDYLPQRVLPKNWRFFPDSDYRGGPHLIAGALLGSVAGAISLLANAIGTLLLSLPTDFSQNPFRLVQVYLTFPFGEAALHFTTSRVLVAGITVYLLTGMFYGAICEATIHYVLPGATWIVRTVVFSSVSLLLWIINFYCVLSWLQPLMLGGDWIVRLVPWWVAAVTHLIFGATLASFYPFGLRTRPVHASLQSESESRSSRH